MISKQLFITILLSISIFYIRAVSRDDYFYWQCARDQESASEGQDDNSTFFTQRGSFDCIEEYDPEKYDQYDPEYCNDSLGHFVFLSSDSDGSDNVIDVRPLGLKRDDLSYGNNETLNTLPESKKPLISNDEPLEGNCGKPILDFDGFLPDITPKKDSEQYPIIPACGAATSENGHNETQALRTNSWRGASIMFKWTALGMCLWLGTSILQRVWQQYKLNKFLAKYNLNPATLTDTQRKLVEAVFNKDYDTIALYKKDASNDRIDKLIKDMLPQ